MNETNVNTSVEEQNEIRESFSGVLLDDRLYADLHYFAKYVGRQLEFRGYYDSVLEKVAMLVSDLERTITSKRAKSIIVDFYKAQNGISLYDRALQIEEVEDNLFESGEDFPDDVVVMAVSAVENLKASVEQGHKFCSARGLGNEAALIATKVGTSILGAKRVIREVHNLHAGTDMNFDDLCTELDNKYYYPAVEEEIRKSKNRRRGRRTPSRRSFGKQYN